MNRITCSMLTLGLSLAIMFVTVATGAGNDQIEQTARHQQEAAKTIVMYGGFVSFQDGSHCRADTSLFDHRTKSVTLVDISEEELMINAPTGLGIKDCLGQLKYFPKLRTLTLGNPDIDDGMLKYLEPLNQLRDLVIANEEITDAGLEHLTKLNDLRTLHLRATKTTDEGVKKLQRVLPRCKITIEK